MRLVPVSVPAKEPVTLAEMKAHLRVDLDADDALIQAKISAARQYAEQYTRRAFITQTWEMVLDRAPAEIEIPLPPLQEVTKIEVVDSDGAKTEVPASSYWMDFGHGSPGRIRLKDSSTWPLHRGFASFIITFKAGYGDTETDVPEKIREAIKKRAALLYESREDGTIQGSSHPLTNEIQEADALLYSYRVFRKSTP